MKNLDPYLVVYGRTYAEAMDVVHRRRLMQCEPVWESLTAVAFSDQKDLVLFALEFRAEAFIEDSLAVLHPMHKVAVMDFIHDYGMADRVDCMDVLGVWFSSTDDETTFNEELGLTK
jgi:hypothetical protein